MIQLSDDSKYYAAGDQGMTPNGVEYIRQMPDQFNEDSPNNFMRAMITDYALEKKAEDGKPTGEFKMNQKQTQLASRDILKKFKKIDGKELDDYMK